MVTVGLAKGTEGPCLLPEAELPRRSATCPREEWPSVKDGLDDLLLSRERLDAAGGQGRVLLWTRRLQCM